MNFSCFSYYKLLHKSGLLEDIFIRSKCTISQDKFTAFHKNLIQEFKKNRKKFNYLNIIIKIFFGYFSNVNEYSTIFLLTDQPKFVLFREKIIKLQYFDIPIKYRARKLLWGYIFCIIKELSKVR